MDPLTDPPTDDPSGGDFDVFIPETDWRGTNSTTTQSLCASPQISSVIEVSIFLALNLVMLILFAAHLCCRNKSIPTWSIPWLWQRIVVAMCVCSFARSTEFVIIEAKTSLPRSIWIVREIFMTSILPFFASGMLFLAYKTLRNVDTLGVWKRSEVRSPSTKSLRSQGFQGAQKKKFSSCLLKACILAVVFWWAFAYIALALRIEMNSNGATVGFLGSITVFILSVVGLQAYAGHLIIQLVQDHRKNLPESMVSRGSVVSRITVEASASVIPSSAVGGGDHFSIEGSTKHISQISHISFQRSQHRSTKSTVQRGFPTETRENNDSDERAGVASANSSISGLLQLPLASGHNLVTPCPPSAASSFQSVQSVNAPSVMQFFGRQSTSHLPPQQDWQEAQLGEGTDRSVPGDVADLASRQLGIRRPQRIQTLHSPQRYSPHRLGAVSPNRSPYSRRQSSVRRSMSSNMSGGKQRTMVQSLRMKLGKFSLATGLAALSISVTVGFEITRQLTSSGCQDASQQLGLPAWPWTVNMCCIMFGAWIGFDPRACCARYPSNAQNNGSRFSSSRASSLRWREPGSPHRISQQSARASPATHNSPSVAARNSSIAVPRALVFTDKDESRSSKACVPPPPALLASRTSPPPAHFITRQRVRSSSIPNAREMPSSAILEIIREMPEEMPFLSPISSTAGPDGAATTVNCGTRSLHSVLDYDTRRNSWTGRVLPGRRSPDRGRLRNGHSQNKQASLPGKVSPEHLSGVAGKQNHPPGHGHRRAATMATTGLTAQVSTRTAMELDSLEFRVNLPKLPSYLGTDC